MPVSPFDKPVYRFAPSPNGPLHLGHALSALLNHDMAMEAEGHFLLRIEDIDLARCTPEFEQGIYRDLAWLGVAWETPARRQSDHFSSYEAALDRLRDMDLVYPAFMTRGEVRAQVRAFETDGKIWPRDPDGAPLYPPEDKHRSRAERQAFIAEGKPHAFRLDMEKALQHIRLPLVWTETGDSHQRELPADPSEWGDVVLSRSDAPSSYHLSVVVDDAAQGVTHVVRGLDLFASTAVHRLLQELLQLPSPFYHHHRLILGEDGRKLSKSAGSTGLATLRGNGFMLGDVRRLVGL
ncbi:tRNA glutamyl-Q(34) synthetase GluQRS [Rhizobium deserti]|uniref:tRNA glutamyl-Q(34) synthetase GluQRS n=1 Tax=Rhizobium deserti TaxID=2547961 RepID=A0A4R5UGC6_9HYPH|nr:tRNA glutamyl-Q(34) synthetase GluQRS [Rhizobium deserti]TDK34582.1 tRNA glutamyl-Q(34) synthetase GluQRS [Rhizobium deserti]